MEVGDICKGEAYESTHLVGSLDLRPVVSATSPMSSQSQPLPNVLTARRCSFAYGTPPHINRLHFNVSFPDVESLVDPETGCTGRERAAEAFIALCNLTEILGKMLDHLYDLSINDTAVEATTKSYRRIEISIYDWEEALPSALRSQVAGTRDLSIKGAANLRLCFLSTKFLLQKMQFDSTCQDQSSPPEAVSVNRKATQKVAKEIADFVTKLRPLDLGDFWLPMGAFLLSSAATFLLRCVLDNLNDSSGGEGTSALHEASRMIDALKSHRDGFGWDLGDVCLAQCEPLVHRVSQAFESQNMTSSGVDLADQDPLEGMGIDAFGELMPSIWDTFDFDLGTFQNF